MSAGTLITILALGWTIALLLAAWWAWGSVRSWWFSRGGKRVGTRYCRACSFDLTGLTRDNTTPATRCPECGAEIDRAGAGVVGKAVRRRPILKWFALGVGVLTGAGVLVSLYLRPPVEWIGWMPQWMLIHSARTGESEVAQRALQHLGRRWGYAYWATYPSGSGQFVPPQFPRPSVGGVPTPDAAALADLARVAIERQADRERAWIPAWGDMIESAIAENLLTPDEIVRYRSNWLVLDLRFSPRIRRGEPLMADVTITSVRTPRQLDLRLAVSGANVRDALTNTHREGQNIVLYEGSVIRLPVHGTRGLSLGVNEIEVAQIVESDTGVKTIVETPISSKVSVDVLAPDWPLSPAIHDVALDNAMKELLRDPEMSLYTTPGNATPHSAIWVSLRVTATRTPPVAFSARVEVRDCDSPMSDAIASGKIIVRESGPQAAVLIMPIRGGVLPPCLAKPWVHVRFVSDGSLVDSLTQPDGYWDGQIDFPDVPIYSRGVPGLPDRERPR